MFKIFKKSVQDKNVYLQLQEDGDGGIDLIAVDAAGEERDAGYLLTFNEDGSVTRHPELNEDLGFNLDDKGCLDTTP